jgi:WD40 repeat protein
LGLLIGLGIWLIARTREQPAPSPSLQAGAGLTYLAGPTAPEPHNDREIAAKPATPPQSPSQEQLGPIAANGNARIGPVAIPQSTGLDRPRQSPPAKPSLAPGEKTPPVKDDIPVGEIRRFEGHTKGVNSVACSADGHRALSASDDETLRLWDVDSGKELLNIQAHPKGVRRAALSADGRRALSIGGEREMCLWDLETGKEIRRFKDVGEGEKTVVFSPDSRRALSGDYYGFVRLWDVQTGEAIRRFEGHSNAITGVAFTPDGKRVLSCSQDLTVRVWDAQTGKQLRQFSGHTGYVHCLAVSADGRKLLSGSGGRLGEEPGLFFNDAPRPKMIADRDTDLRLWDLETGKAIRTFNGHRIYVNSVAFSPDGRWALSSNGGALVGFERGTIMGAFGGADNLLPLWDVDTGKELQSFKGHADVVRCVVFVGDGRRALSASADKTVRLWGLPSPRASSLALSPDSAEESRPSPADRQKPDKPDTKVWQVRLKKAVMQDAYTEGDQRDDLTIKPTKPDTRVAVITIEFEALSAFPGPPTARLEADRKALPKGVYEYLLDTNVPQLVKNLGGANFSKLLAKPARLFVSAHVELVLADKTRLQPSWTSREIGGISVFSPHGDLHVQMRLGFPMENETDPDVLRHIVVPDATAVLVQPRRKVILQLVYMVPKGTEKATLHFYDCDPVEITLGQCRRPWDHPRARC